MAASRAAFSLAKASANDRNSDTNKCWRTSAENRASASIVYMGSRRDGQGRSASDRSQSASKGSN